MLASGVYGVVARQIVRNGGFDPDDLSMLDSVFAHSWTLIESQYTFANWEGRNASRERLATIIVALAKKHHLRKRLLVVRAASSFKTTPRHDLVLLTAEVAQPCKMMARGTTNRGRRCD